MLPEQIDELEIILREATAEVEKALELDVKGWQKLGGGNLLDMSGASRSEYVKRSRYYYNFDPLASQAIRLWTDYTFGSGISFRSENEQVQDVISAFWLHPDNRKLLSEQGQRKSCDKCLVDGEVFFALFLGASGEVRIRWIDPLEITEIITDPDDIETVRYYKREWSNPQGKQFTSYYRDVRNTEDEATPDSQGKTITATEDALVYHLAFHTIGQRGNPLLLPVLDWIEQYRRFMAARIAIVRALSRFVWKNKVMGGAGAVAGMKSTINNQKDLTAATVIENQASNLEPVKTDTGSYNAKEDGRMIKTQICVGVGILPHYMGDLETSNLATAKSVELPMLKMFESYQQMWTGALRDIFNVVLDHNGISDEDRFIDIDFPAIVPADAQYILQAINNLILSFPEFADSPDVQKMALTGLGLNNVDEVLSNLESQAKESSSEANVSLIKALKALREAIGNGAKPDNNRD